jgi:y4mF family transcriptional regulator
MHDRTSETFVVRLGRAVRKRRERLGLHQVDLAELAGCSTRFVHTVEAGKGTVRIDKLASVLRVLGLRFWLELGGVDEIDPSLQAS